MKKQLLLSFIIFILTFILFSSNSLAQTLTPEFEFQLYFEDAVGNRDTITLGYDSLATNGIDEQFEEVNILDEPWSSTDFQVRITNLYPGAGGGPSQFATKKQIIENRCHEQGFWNMLFIDFKNAVFPIKIHFDYDTFIQDDCVKGSLLESVEPNLLWDATGGYYSNMQNFVTGEIIIDTIGSIENYNIGTTKNDASYCFYQDEDGKTIFTLWLLFSEKDLQTIGIDENFLIEESPKIIPSPFDETFSIKGLDSPKSIRIHDMLGNRIPYLISGNTMITPLTDKSGVYFISFNANETFYNLKTIKK